MIEQFITAAKRELHLIDNIPVIVSREDLAFSPPLAPNAKTYALIEIIKREAANGYKTMVMFTKKQQGTPYAIGFPYICAEFNVKPIIAYPATGKHPLPDFIQKLLYTENPPRCEFVQLHPNMISINVNQAKQIAEDHQGYFIPFGMDDALGVEAYAKHFEIPANIKTVVMATMTGMTLAGAILNAQRKHISNELKDFPKFIGVSCGRPTDNVLLSMKKYITLPTFDKLQLYDYGRAPMLVADTPFPLHPDYEAKAWFWLKQHIKELDQPVYFINVGR